MIGGLTYILVYDRNDANPTSHSPYEFTDYSEAMSYAKWTSLITIGGVTPWKVTVWNWYGNSGIWADGVYSDIANSNYPTP
jgi:hypothetical protein